MRAPKKNLLPQNLHLLTDRLLVDGLQHRAHEFAVHAQLHGLRGTPRQQLLVTLRLQNRHVVLLLVLPDVARDAHPPYEEFQQLVVELVDLGAQLVEILGRRGLLADDQIAQDVGQRIGRHLLGLVAPCRVGRAVRLDDQAVESEVHGLLRERCDQFTLAADVARVAEDRQRRQTPVQLDGDGPHRMVAVEALVDRGESAVDGAQTADSGVVDAFDGSDPEFEVRADGVLHQHRDVHAAQGVGDLLHGEGVGRRAGPDPEQVDAPFQGRLDMLVRGDFGGGVHARFALYALHPGDSLLADAFESAGFRAGLPEPGAVDADSFGGQYAGRVEELFFGFGAARTGNDQRPAGVDSGECDGLKIVHGVFCFFDCL